MFEYKKAAVMRVTEQLYKYIFSYMITTMIIYSLYKNLPLLQHAVGSFCPEEESHDMLVNAPFYVSLKKKNWFTMNNCDTCYF